MLLSPIPALRPSVHGLALLGEFVLLAVAYQADRRQVWLVCLAGIALLGFAAWLTALRRRRTMLDTPTSRIASAAQGYVELSGVGRPLDINPLYSPLSGSACLWYRYQVEERGEHRWEVVERDESHSCFVLDDGSGRCLVDPERAEILTRHCKRWQDGERRFVEWTLLQRDALYVLGDFVTHRASEGLNAAEDIKQMLAAWKQDQPALLRRFDLNGDGQLDMQEWALARRAARREVARHHQELRNHDDLHLVRRPLTRLFLISNIDPARLARRFLWRGAFHLLCFLVALGYFGFWWQSA